MEVVTKFAIVAAVAVVFVGVLGGILYTIPAIPTVGDTGNEALDWTLVKDIVHDSCYIFGHFMIFPPSFIGSALTALAGAIGIRIGITVYNMI